jgi:hypothetical protein
MQDLLPTTKKVFSNYVQVVIVEQLKSNKLNFRKQNAQKVKGFEVKCLKIELFHINV